MRKAKKHLIPKAMGGEHSICSTRARKVGQLAVATRAEFNALPIEERCARCDLIINGTLRKDKTLV
jgi:hypothetical protein